MSADTIISRSMREIPKCVAAGVVDMETGMLLSVKTIESHPQEVLDLVAAATRDMFEGDNVVTIERLFKRIRGVQHSDEHYFRQIVVMSRNLIHFFSRLENEESVVMVAVCRADANLGLILAKGRMIAKSENL
ncbi:MAG: hypothetical protein MJE77_45890 [Proteobacteria bacterium]|nr:hypothetical protein [Pseudomonadota bacterium]